MLDLDIGTKRLQVTPIDSCFTTRQARAGGAFDQYFGAMLWQTR